MSTFGNTTTPAAGWELVGSAGSAAATSFTGPSTGAIVTTLHGYFDAGSGNPTGYLVIWDNSGNVLGSVNIGTLPVGSQSAGGQAWHSGTLGTPVTLTASQVVWLGFVASANLLFSSETGGSSYKVAMTSPASFTGQVTTGIGAVGAYADYTPPGGKVWNGSAWTAIPPKVWNGSAWVQSNGKVWNGSAWVLTT